MLHNKHVLIIDDADTIRTYLHSVLTQKGAVVDGASTGQEGLAKCAEKTYDLILLDLFLPDTDGIEVLKNIRMTNDTSTIVMITGFGGIGSAITAVQLGADGYIEKQNITSTHRDHVEFVYCLDQAMEHRAGLVAQKQLDQIRADFYAMVTHDLRNPVTQILMAGTMLIDGSVVPLTPPQHELVMMVNMAAERLLYLTNDYLDLAKIDAGYLRLEFAQVELTQLVRSSTRLAQLQAQAKRQTFTLDVPTQPVLAWVDAERLKQVLDNLLSNAIKYTPEGGQITLQLSVEAGHAVFCVRDTGIGVSPEYLSRLFTKYHRVPGEATRGVAGTGLGLLIVKEIVEAHGGTVSVASDAVPGKGAAFTVKIPLSQKEQPQHVADYPVESAHAPEPMMAYGETEDFFEEAELRQLFWEEAQGHLATLQEAFAGLSLASDDQELLNKARHASHTLRGNAGTMQLHTVYELATLLDEPLQQAARRSLRS
jgi:signal transduction histidine kinase/HPt (histidine-containing phosphotransfer) domain-containing protein